MDAAWKSEKLLKIPNAFENVTTPPPRRRIDKPYI
jgi:hypothetical protein